MTGGLLFVAAQIAVVAFGLPAAFHPSLRGTAPVARIGAAFGAGAVSLTVVATLFSTLGIPWGLASLGLPLLAISIGLSIRWSRRPPLWSADRSHAASAPAVRAVAAAVMGVALIFLFLELAASRATSADFALFWGVKGARFAASRGIDATLLGAGFSHHLVPDYPPLVPIGLAWTALVAGVLPWKLAPIGAAIWVAAAVALVAAFLRRRLSEEATLAVTAFWTVALSLSTVHSRSGGNAEAPLLFFETVALAALLVESPAGPPSSRFLPALALAGATLSKVEGAVAVILIVIGVAVRDGLQRRPEYLRRLVPILAAPLGAFVLWLAFQAAHGLRLGYRTHGGLVSLHFDFLSSVLSGMAKNLHAGAGWLSWLLPLAVLVTQRFWKRLDLWPALSLSAGLFLFFVFDYLHDPTDPSIRIGWTLPRISQPAMSALILAAGLAGGSAAPRGGEAGRAALPEPVS